MSFFTITCKIVWLRLMAVHGHRLRIFLQRTFSSYHITHFYLTDSASFLHLLRYDVLQLTATVGWLRLALASQQLGQHILHEGCPEYYRRIYPLNGKVTIVKNAPMGFKGHAAGEGQEEGPVYRGAYHSPALLLPLLNVFEVIPRAVVVPY